MEHFCGGTSVVHLCCTVILDTVRFRLSCNLDIQCSLKCHVQVALRGRGFGLCWHHCSHAKAGIITQNINPRFLNRTNITVGMMWKKIYHLMVMRRNRCYKYFVFSPLNDCMFELKIWSSWKRKYILIIEGSIFGVQLFLFRHLMFLTMEKNCNPKEKLLCYSSQVPRISRNFPTNSSRRYKL